MLLDKRKETMEVEISFQKEKKIIYTKEMEQQSKTDAQTNNQASKNNIHFNIDTIST